MPAGALQFGLHVTAPAGAAQAAADGADAARASFVEGVVSRLAAALREGGFGAARRGTGAGSAAGQRAVAERAAERAAQLRAATRRLVAAALLASACLTGHLAHIWPGDSRITLPLV